MNKSKGKVIWDLMMINEIEKILRIDSESNKSLKNINKFYIILGVRYCELKNQDLLNNEGVG